VRVSVCDWGENNNSLELDEELLPVVSAVVQELLLLTCSCDLCKTYRRMYTTHLRSTPVCGEQQLEGEHDTSVDDR
jgi:hypothetical protein